MEKKDRLRRIYQEALDLSFSGFSITEYTELPTYKVDETGRWVSDSKAVFITCRYNENFSGFGINYNYRDISNHLENLFGFECNVQIFQN
jgi:hypothetical protein